MDQLSIEIERNAYTFYQTNDGFRIDLEIA